MLYFFLNADKTDFQALVIADFFSVFICVIYICVIRVSLYLNADKTDASNAGYR